MLRNKKLDLRHDVPPGNCYTGYLWLQPEKGGMKLGVRVNERRDVPSKREKPILIRTHATNHQSF
jgi:hypothetical protein